jgi:hypothetical protein
LLVIVEILHGRASSWWVIISPSGILYALPPPAGSLE